MIDLSKIRVGDEVTVRANVVGIGRDGLELRALRDGLLFWACLDDIATHTPKPREFKPGDRVTWEGGWLGEFVAQRHGIAAVWVGTHGWKDPEVSMLRHADERE